MTDTEKINLMGGEIIIRNIKPHILAFYDMYLLWVYLILIVFVLAFLTDSVKSYIAPYIVSFSMAAGLWFKLLGWKMFNLPEYTFLILWWIVLSVTAIIISVIKISFKWIAILLGIAVVSTLIGFGIGSGDMAPYISIPFAIAGCFATELYRQAHEFIITNFRIITKVDFIGFSENELGYNKIENLVIQQGIVAKCFNFGTITPITASGLGMGQDIAMVGAATGGTIGPIPVGVGVAGGRTVNIPRSRSRYELFGIPSPRDVYDEITNLMHKSEEAPYLKEMSKDIRDIKDITIKKRKDD